MLPYLNKTDKKSVDEDYLKKRRLRNAVSIKRNLSKIEFDKEDKILGTVFKTQINNKNTIDRHSRLGAA